MVSKLTKLEAVNTMLTAIGESPVSSLDTASATADVIMAKSLLEEVNREVQTQGWHFNTEYNYPLVPDNNKEIHLPNNTASVDVTNPSYLDCVERKGKLYSRYNQSYKFDSTVYADLTLLFEFDEIPEAARRYIMIRAARKFVDGILKDGNIRAFTQEDEYRALADLQAEEANSADYTIFDSYDMHKITNRTLGL